MPARVGRLRTSQRWAVYISAMGLLLTGAIWLYFYYFVRVVDQFGFENPHPLQGTLMIAHAVFALPAIWIYGFMWQIHVKPGWRARTRRWSGGSIWSLVLWMSLTGYALYYIGSDSLRGWVSIAHWVAGLAALVVFLVHMRSAASDDA